MLAVQRSAVLESTILTPIVVLAGSVLFLLILVAYLYLDKVKAESQRTFDLYPGAIP